MTQFKRLLSLLLILTVTMLCLVSYNFGKMVGWEMGWNAATENYFTNEASREFPVIFKPTGFGHTNIRFLKYSFSKNRIFK